MPPRLLNLPPLDLFRGFVAVGRSLSVTAAARELAITQPALSRQIHALEDTLGCALFVRKHRSLELTPEGTRLLRTADAWLDQLAEAIEALRPVDPSSVAVTTSTGFAALWLLPRLGELQAAHPEVDLRVVAANRVLDLEREAIDLAVRYCPTERAPEGAVQLFGEELVPVASTPVDLDDPAQLGFQVLLDYDDPAHPLLHWAHWLRAAGAARPRPGRVLRFTQYEQAVQSALAGQGVALGRSPWCGRSSPRGSWCPRAADGLSPSATPTGWCHGAGHSVGTPAWSGRGSSRRPRESAGDHRRGKAHGARSTGPLDGVNRPPAWPAARGAAVPGEPGAIPGAGWPSGPGAARLRAPCVLSSPCSLCSPSQAAPAAARSPSTRAA